MKIVKAIFISLLSILVLALLVAFILYTVKNPEVKTLDEAARKNAPGSFVQLSQGVTHYQLQGPDTGKLVVLVHGFSVPYYIWDSTFTALVKAGYRVLRYDMLGRGFSDRPDVVYEAPVFRQQLADLLEKLNIHKVYAIAGVSFGGPVVADFVVHNPAMVDKVILVDPVFAAFAKPAYPENIARFLMAVTPGDMVKGQLTDLKYPDSFPAWGQQYKAGMQYKGFRNALVSTRAHYTRAGGVEANYKSLDSLHKPVLLFWGRDDNTLPFENNTKLRQLLHTEFFPVDDAGHLPQMEKAAVVNEKILSFLQ